MLLKLIIRKRRITCNSKNSHNRVNINNNVKINNNNCKNNSNSKLISITVVILMATTEATTIAIIIQFSSNKFNINNINIKSYNNK